MPAHGLSTIYAHLTVHTAMWGKKACVLSNEYRQPTKINYRCIWFFQGQRTLKKAVLTSRQIYGYIYLYSSSMAGIHDIWLFCDKFSSERPPLSRFVAMSCHLVHTSKVSHEGGASRHTLFHRADNFSVLSLTCFSPPLHFSLM